jgi:hypothetical protein
MERTNEVFKGVVGIIAGPGSVALSFEERLSLALRLLGLLLGCGVSAAMIWSIVVGRLAKRRLEKEEERVKYVAWQREMAKLCHWCQLGQPPPECPLAPGKRPEKCPLKHPEDHSI